MRRHRGFVNEYKINGDTTTIYLVNRHGKVFETVIDTEDLQKLIDLDLYWGVKYEAFMDEYYARAAGNRKRGDKVSVYLHVVVMDFNFDHIHYVDHRNYNTLDNRKSNLRIAKISENSRHRRRINKNNTSGYRNVSLDKRKNEWKVQLQDHDGKTKCFKRFPYEQLHEAGQYAQEKRKELYGEFAGESE